MRYIYLMLVPAIMLAGCNSPTDENAAGDALKRDWCSTPGKTLEAMARIWNHSRNAEDYAFLLTGDYHFYFAPGDVGKKLKDGYIIPATWDKAEDVQATANMFAPPSEGGAYDISMDILYSGDYDYDPGGTEFTAENVLMQIYIWPTSPDFGSLATGSCTFDFRKIDDMWLISGWHDDEDGAFGELRAQYHP
jgi:hypothetical protein